MSLIQKAISSLYLGVSQQETTNRIDGQVSEMINMMPEVSKGVSRRNPTEFLASIPVSSSMFMHSYSRGDNEEEYIIFIDGITSSILVFTSDGVQVPVVLDAGVNAYLASTNSIASFKALTVGDTTFLINKNKVCQMLNTYDGVAEENYQHPFYWIKRTYDNGSGTGYDYTALTATTNSVKSTTAVSSLATSLGAGWIAQGSILFSTTTRNSSYNFTWSDSYGSQASEGFHGTAQKLADLPNDMAGLDATYNIILEIVGDEQNSFTNFWVRYEDGTWKETRKPYMKNSIDNTTMPIKLVRQADSTFKASFIDYDERLVGDETTSSGPSFIGKTIKSLFFFKNRLCFVSDENIIMSEVGSFYNFFPTTVTDVLDSDPIDVAVDSNNVSLINHAIPFDNNVILLSASTQFSLTADKVLSPNDVSIMSTTNYSSSGIVSPIGVGSSLFFLSTTLKGTSLMEYYVNNSQESTVALDVSGHTPEYIPSSIINMVGNTNQNIIIMLSSESPDTLYVYKYFNNGNDRIQTAWSKWVFGGSISNIAMLSDYLYIIINRGSGNTLERLDYSSNSTVGSFKDNGSIQYESSVKLSELVLKDANGKLIQSAKAPLIYRTLQLKSKRNSVYKVIIENIVANRVVERFALKDNKFLVQGKSNEIVITVKSVDENPLEFHTYTIEANYNIRSKII